jgi:acetyl-CoA C-acetyltransferase
MSVTKVVICSAVRTPIGAIGGQLQALQAKDLAAIAANGAVSQATGLNKKDVDYITMGWVMQDCRAPNIARVAADAIGLPSLTPGLTVHQNCASGGAAMHDIARRIKAGEISLGIAGGAESMSNVPRYLFTGRLKSQLYGDMTIVDGLMAALTDTTVGKKGELMGLLTERLVKKYGLTREEQDDIAFASHANAIKAQTEGAFDYVLKVEVPGKKKGEVKVIDKDEGPKVLDRAFFAKQKAYFVKQEEGGTITGANASSLNDGAAAVVLASEQRAKELGLPVLAEFVTCGDIGVPKELMGEGAFKILPKILKQAGMTVDDIDYFEMNEAFAAVVGGAFKDVKGLKAEKVNQWGSGISLGHPVGCTGARQVVDMVHQLGKRGKTVGLTSRCVGGGIGSGEIIKKL